MVERTAFTQLRYSIWLLLATTFVMVLVFWFPWSGPALFFVARRQMFRRRRSLRDDFDLPADPALL